jgi:phosphatidylserine synthase
MSLTCCIVSILASAGGNFKFGGALILASYILDLFDGEMARRLRAGSAFGLQLDSLVDMVSLGTAPAVLAFFHSFPWPEPSAWPALICCRSRPVRPIQWG